MAKKGDLTLCKDVLQPLRQLINKDSPKDKLASASKQMYSDSTISLEDGLNNLLTFGGGKRKSSICMDDICSPEKRTRPESSSMPPSPTPASWEVKRLKIDLIAAKSQLTKLESRINHQHTISMEKQILFEEEKGSLIEQHKRDERALSDMKDKLEFTKRSEQELKDDYNQVIKEHRESKAMWDKQKEELQKEIADMREKLLDGSASSKNQLSEIMKDMNEMLQALEGAQSEVEMLKTEVAKQTTRAKQCTNLRGQLEKQTFELQSVTNQLKKLEYEYERDCYKECLKPAEPAKETVVVNLDMDKCFKRPD